MDSSFSRSDSCFCALIRAHIHGFDFGISELDLDFSSLI